jgi:malonyl CoA-acyl carrier protein transacylase
MRNITRSFLKSQLSIKLLDYCRFIMGHSLGEYTALVVAGYLQFEDAIWLVVSKKKSFLYNSM